MNSRFFTAAIFPANSEYAADLTSPATKIAKQLVSYGVLGRFSIDFISVKEKDQWKHYAIEINLRKGGHYASLPDAPVFNGRSL
jgi:hypothetical protein